MDAHTTRLNKFLAARTDLSRRAADKAITDGRVLVNGHQATTGMTIDGTEQISLDGKPIALHIKTTTIMLNKPRGYVVSRNGQGSRTVYELLPASLHHLNPVGRLDKDSSGLLLLTNDGQLAEQLTHPRYQKTKVYEVSLDRELAPLHRQMIADFGVHLEDGPSKLGLERMHEGNEKAWLVTMQEGRNRQIRRTFESLGYSVRVLHRTQFGSYALNDLTEGKYYTFQDNTDAAASASGSAS
jgi:23S rRNA pseudouridine2605 synthase